LHWRKLVPNLW
jgi:Leucine-rich repeat (LRR) protein